MVKPSPKPNNCRHENIYWEDFFKEPKKNKAYCVDCDADKGRIFASALQKWYHEKIREWLKDNGLMNKYTQQGKEVYTDIDFMAFLKENNYKDIWWNSWKIDEDYYDGLGGQMIFFEFAKNAEDLCREFAQEKKNNPAKPNEDNQQKEQLEQRIKDLENKPNRTPYQEKQLAKKRKKLLELTKPVNNPLKDKQKQQLQQEITNLTNKPNKTSEEEAELAEKRTKLKNLTEQPTKNPNSNNFNPLYLIVPVLALVILVIILIFTKKVKNSKYEKL